MMIFIIVMFFGIIARAEFVVGVTHVAGDYSFEPKNYLVEGADRIEALRSPGAFFYLSNSYLTDYPDNGSQMWSGFPKSLAELAEQAPYRHALGKPFKMILLTVYGFCPSNRIFNLTEEELACEEQELYELTKKLLSDYAGSNKTFVLKNWEGDWHGLMNYDTGPDLEAKRADDLIRWFQARQRGVERARAEGVGVGVQVYHAIEVNRVLDVTEGKKRLLNAVIPKVKSDMVTYSAWDALFSEAAKTPAGHFRVLKDAIDLIDQLTPDPLQLGKSRIILSEVGAFENRLPQRDDLSYLWRIKATLRYARAWGLGGAFFWQLFDNECKGSDGLDITQRALPVGHTSRPQVEDCPGLWLVRPDGTAGALVPLLKGLWTP